jgi:hypothetical protein
MPERRPSATRLAGYDIGSKETPAAVIIRRHPDGHLSADVQGNIPPLELAHTLQAVAGFIRANPNRTHGEYREDGTPPRPGDL